MKESECCPITIGSILITTKLQKRLFRWIKLVHYFILLIFLLLMLGNYLAICNSVNFPRIQIYMSLSISLAICPLTVYYYIFSIWTVCKSFIVHLFNISLLPFSASSPPDYIWHLVTLLSIIEFSLMIPQCYVYYWPFSLR